MELNLTVNRFHDENNKKIEYNFKFEYRDLCYAIAKGMTAVLKDYGFYGYYYSTSDYSVNVHQLLFLKAVALDCMQAQELKRRGEYGDATDFDSELQLLLFDM